MSCQVQIYLCTCLCSGELELSFFIFTRVSPGGWIKENQARLPVSLLLRFVFFLFRPTRHISMRPTQCLNGTAPEKGRHAQASLIYSTSQPSKRGPFCFDKRLTWVCLPGFQGSLRIVHD